MFLFGEQLVPLKYWFDWSVVRSEDSNIGFSGYSSTGHYSNPPPSEMILLVLFICGVQAYLTLALHCVELIVNLSRDESAWRKADVGKKEASSGANVLNDPLFAAAASLENIILFIAKALIHAMVGQGVTPHLVSDPKNGGEYFVVVGFLPKLILFAICPSVLPHSQQS
mgnify:FL=1